MSQFAVVNHQGVATVVSHSLRGAKNQATRHGYTKVCQVSKYSMSCYNFCEKAGKVWREVQS